MIQKGPLEAREFIIKTLLSVLETLPTVLSEKELLPDEKMVSKVMNEEWDSCEAYDWLPSLVRTVTPSMQSCCYDPHTSTQSLAIAFMYHAHLQGILYGTDCIDAVIHLLPSKARVVRKLAERLVTDIIHQCASIVLTRMASAVVKEASTESIQALQLPFKVLISVNERLAAKYLLYLITLAFGDRINLKGDLVKLLSIAQLSSALTCAELRKETQKLLPDALNRADLCHILSFYTSLLFLMRNE